MLLTLRDLQIKLALILLKKKQQHKLLFYYYNWFLLLYILTIVEYKLTVSCIIFFSILRRTLFHLDRIQERRTACINGGTKAVFVLAAQGNDPYPRQNLVTPGALKTPRGGEGVKVRIGVRVDVHLIWSPEGQREGQGQQIQACWETHRSHISGTFWYRVGRRHSRVLGFCWGAGLNPCSKTD